jgi:putative transposase
MRYPASEKLEVIHLVERSHLLIKQTLDKLGIPRTTFYRWYDHYQVSGPEALEDQSPRPSRVWNHLPDDVRQRIVDLALDVPELSPPELAVRFTDTEEYFVSEASVYRLLKSLDLITSPAFRKTTSSRPTWRRELRRSSIITITSDTARALTISRPQTFTSGVGNQF